MPRPRRSTDTPHVIVTDGLGDVNLRLQEGSPIGRTPITGLGQVVTTGDTAQRQDQRTPQVIWANQQGGMGEFQYTETEGIESFTESGCDSRYPGMIVLPPEPVARGVMSPTPYNFAEWYVEWTGATGAEWLVWMPAPLGSSSSAVRYHNGTGWVEAQAGGAALVNTTGYTKFNGRHYITAATGSVGVYHSTDAKAWTAYGHGQNFLGRCVHDEKFFVYSEFDRVLAWTTDPLTAYSGWAKSSAIRLAPGERIRQVVEWRDAQGRATVYLVGTYSIRWYDEDADVFHLFYRIVPQRDNTDGRPRAFVWPRDGSLLVAYARGDTPGGGSLLQFTGTTNPVGPNQRGGLSDTSRTELYTLAGGLHWVYVAAPPTLANEPVSGGRVLAMNDQGGWHTLYAGTASTAFVRSIGYGDGRIMVLLSDRSSYELRVSDSRVLPIFDSGRRYRPAATFFHEYAYTDGGTPNMDKQALWATIQCIDHTTTHKIAGMPAGCYALVQYRRDTDDGWTSIGILNPLTTYPAVMPINAGKGVSFKQIKLRVGLSTDIVANTPTVTSVALSYVRQETARYRYTLVADLSGGDNDFYAGVDRVGLARRMETWAQPGSIVALKFAGGDYATRPAESTAIANCTLAFSGEEDPESGPRRYTLAFDDVTPPASG